MKNPIVYLPRSGPVRALVVLHAEIDKQMPEVWYIRCTDGDLGGPDTNEISFPYTRLKDIGKTVAQLVGGVAITFGPLAHPDDPIPVYPSGHVPPRNFEYSTWVPREEFNRAYFIAPPEQWDL